MKKKNYKGGLVKLILLIIVLVLIVSYFGINIRKIVQSDTGKDNFGFIWGILQQIWDFAIMVWDKYLSVPTLFVWNEIIIKLVWNNLVGVLGKIKTQ